MAYARPHSMKGEFMRPMRRQYSSWQPMESPPYVYDSGLKHLPIILLSAFAVAISANGISLMLDAPFVVGLLVSVILSGVRLYYLLRYDSRQERRVANNRDKVIGYFACAALLFLLSAFGLYGLAGVSGQSAVAAGCAANSGITMMAFFRATAAKQTCATVCWIVAGSVEGFTHKTIMGGAQDI